MSLFRRLSSMQFALHVDSGPLHENINLVTAQAEAGSKPRRSPWVSQVNLERTYRHCIYYATKTARAVYTGLRPGELPALVLEDMASDSLFPPALSDATHLRMLEPGGSRQPGPHRQSDGP